MNSRSFSSDALKGCPNMQLSEGPFNGASVPENGTWRINKDSVSLSEPLPYIVALPMEEGVPQDVTVRPSSEALMYHNTSRPRSSNVVVSSSGEDLLSEVVSPLPQPMEKLHFTLPPPFLTKIYDLVEDVATNYTVSWSSGNNSFVVWNLSEFSQSLLPRYFKHNNFSSFVRQLNTYGFKKICSDRWEFAHKAFLRGQKHLLKDIHRRKPGTHVERQQELDSNLGAVAPLTEQCDERGNFGLREEIDCLKRDKSVLAAEVVRLQQQQQAAEHKTRAMAKHVQDAEKRQDLMMNFLAKAVQSPAFFAHLLQQSESRRANYEARKRNCLPLGGEEVMTGLVMDQQAPVDTIKLPTVTDSEEKQGSYCDVEEYDVDSIEKHSKSDSAQIDLTSMNEVVQGPCGVTDSITSVGSGMVQSDGNIPLDYDLFLDNNSGPLHMSLVESTTDLDLVFDMQEFFEELDLAVGDDVDTNPSSSNTFSCGTSDYNLYDKEVSQIIKGILGRDHSTAQQEVTFAADCYLSHNVEVKDLLENDCMMGSV